mmetsp:Transcript_20467/g.57593  ORF Transcript_20467/g.57593 Transcript_20467/m.57593 type:complete len:201 (-) Transcript_20467:266-868(-)
MLLQVPRGHSKACDAKGYTRNHDGQDATTAEAVCGHVVEQNSAYPQHQGTRKCCPHCCCGQDGCRDVQAQAICGHLACAMPPCREEGEGRDKDTSGIVQNDPISGDVAQASSEGSEASQCPGCLRSCQGQCEDRQEGGCRNGLGPQALDRHLAGKANACNLSSCAEALLQQEAIGGYVAGSTSGCNCGGGTGIHGGNFQQ